MSKKIFTLLFSSFLLSAVFAGNSKPMNIKITVKGLENTTFILANYFGDKQYVKDTLYFDAKGTVVIKSDTIYPGGVYLAVFPALGNRYFEFIMSEPQFSLETDTLDLADHMKIYGSLENTLFYGDMKFLGKLRVTSDSINKLYNAAQEPEKEKYKQQLIQIDSTVKKQRSDVMTKHPTLFYAKLIRAMKDIEVPEPKKDANGKVIDPSEQWRFYKAHYWDHIDLMDDRLLRCPVFHNKMKTFFSTTVVQHPDSICDAANETLAKTDLKNEIYKYMLTYIFNEAANSKIMCMDGAYVCIGEKYFCNPALTPWIDSVKRFKICDRVERLKPVLCERKAQRLILPVDSTEMQWKSLYDVKTKYTILAFWDPDCSHCKKEIPVLAEAYHNLKKKNISVETFSPAIMEIENYKDWVEFIKNNNLDWINVCDAKRHSNFRWEWDIQSTPQIYILDSEKNIKARRIGADQVEDFILHMEDPNHKPKAPLKVNDTDKQEGTE